MADLLDRFLVAILVFKLDSFFFYASDYFIVHEDGTLVNIFDEEAFDIGDSGEVVLGDLVSGDEHARLRFGHKN